MENKKEFDNKADMNGESDYNEALEKFRKDWLADIQAKKQTLLPATSESIISNGQDLSCSQTKEDLGFSSSEPNKLEFEDKTEMGNNFREIKSLPKNWNRLALNERKFIGLELYKNAVEEEKKGRLGEALQYYRQAFRIDPDVDLSYRTFLSTQPNEERNSGQVNHLPPFGANTEEFEFVKHIHLSMDYDSHHSSSQLQQSKKVVDWAKLDPMFDTLKKMMKYSKLPDHLSPDQELDELTLKDQNKVKNYRSIEFKKADPLLPCLGQLPDAVILRILQFAIVDDLQSIGRFSNTCLKALFLTRDKVLWKKFGLLHYHPNSQLTKSFNSTHPHDTVQRYVDNNFDNHWRFFMIEYPRLRFDGIYISTCYYIRQGMKENTFNQPIHLITYYRYLRFYPDGSVLKLLTSEEPSDVVPTASLNFPTQDMFKGTYKLTSPQNIHIEVTGNHRPNMVFELELDLKSTHRGKHNKLSWLTYSSHQFDDPTHYSLKQMKPFFFSKVRSYKTEWSDL